MDLNYFSISNFVLLFARLYFPLSLISSLRRQGQEDPVAPFVDKVFVSNAAKEFFFFLTLISVMLRLSPIYLTIITIYPMSRGYHVNIKQ